MYKNFTSEKYSVKFCKGNCGNKATYKGWCKTKWISKNKFCVACPSIEKKRALAISEFRIAEAQRGKNPMQNSEICKKNHSFSRNKKASDTLGRLGILGLLPQQIESTESKERRRKNIKKSLRKLWLMGRHPSQLETAEKRKRRIYKISNTLRILGIRHKLPIQNKTKEEKEKIGKKISRTLRMGIRSGRIKLSKSWKKVPYKNLILRSNWEKIVAEFLDKNKYYWEYETKKIQYRDSERGVKATTIPDFYVPIINTIIEVKSNADYNSQKTKDKIRAIKNEGFNAVLVGRKEINLIKNNNFLINSRK